MNRFVRVAAAAALAVGGAGSLGCVSTGKTDGCDTGRCGTAGAGRIGGEERGICRTFIDPCYPERYNVVARSEVLAPFAAQVHNGHVLNQTIWNWHFDAGTDQLNGAGKAKLDSIAQTRPGPDPRLYLQVARDIGATSENLDKVGSMRDDLNAKRADAVLRYMGAQPSIHPVAYEIFVHDPVVPGIQGEFVAGAFRSQGLGYAGGLRGAGAGTGPIATGGGTAVQVNTGASGSGTTGTTGGTSGSGYAGPGGGGY